MIYVIKHVRFDAYVPAKYTGLTSFVENAKRFKSKEAAEKHVAKFPVPSDFVVKPLSW